MWGLFVGVSLAFALYSFYEEWQQHRLAKKHLAKMRKDFAVGRRWDVAKGQWADDLQLGQRKEEIGDFPMNGNIFNSQGVHVAAVVGSSIFGLKGQKLYDLRGTKIYKLSGELVGHLANMSERRLDRATDKLFPA